MTKIYLPNANALEERISAIYDKFGLNKKELEILFTMAPKREYYYRSNLGSRVFELGLGPLQLAYIAASSKEDQAMVKKLLAIHGKDGFNAEWMRYKGLGEKAVEVFEYINREYLAS
jgi:type IV secretion system protein VirB4